MAWDVHKTSVMKSERLGAGTRPRRGSAMRRWLHSLAAGIVAAGWATASHADPVTIDPNTTQVEAYKGTNPVGFFSNSPYGSDWGPNVGGSGNGIYQTTAATFSWVGNTIDIKFTTGFSGVDSSYQSQYGVTIYAADIFIKSGGGTTLPGPGGFNYAIALGLDGPDGGLTAGLYSVTSELTSQDIWGSRTQFTYGGAFAPASSCTASGCTDYEASPTVLTGGTPVGGIGSTLVSYAPGVGGALGTLDVQLTVSDPSILQTVFGDGFDVFWGTGDCSNAPIWGDVTDFSDPPIPEPGSLALLASALLLWTALRRRRQYAVATYRPRRRISH